LVGEGCGINEIEDIGDVIDKSGSGGAKRILLQLRYIQKMP